MKNDSIVRKQMMLYMATIAIFVAVVCGALTILYTKHYMAEKREELIQQGEKIAQAYKKGYRTGNLSELSYEPVSYTHLYVYKRQSGGFPWYEG